MIKLATYGGGKHKVTFSWRNIDMQIYYIEYKAQSRQGVARILRAFLGALKNIRAELKETPIAQLIQQCKPHGYKWIACHCPSCTIQTLKKDGKTQTNRQLQFDYNFPSYVTIRGLQRLIRERTSRKTRNQSE